MPVTSETNTLSAQPEALAQLDEMLERFWHHVETLRGKSVPANVRHGLATAVAEVAANIIRYARIRSFDFTLSLLDGRTVEARFNDAGVPFRGIPEGDLDPDVLAEGGRGLALARRALHRFEYRRLPDDTNCWTLAVLLPVPA